MRRVLGILVTSVAILSTVALSSYNNIEDEESLQNIGPKIKGITLVAPPTPIDNKPFADLKAIGTEWIALVPYAFTDPEKGGVWFGQQQWWGERIEGIEACIKYAHQNDIKVMLKPQIWASHQWIGDLDFENADKWQAWEAAYTEYVMTFVELANKYKVEMVCIGTEINHSTDERPEFWRSLIKKIKQSYTGKLTYSANWDHYPLITFWDELDYVGISSYFPLDNDKTPDITNLQKAWKPICKDLKKYSQKVKKPILFTEYGYLAVDGCAGKTWEIEPKRKELPMNDKAQANAYDALWHSLHSQSCWAGGFVWKWFPEGLGHEGIPTKDYSPQGKVGQDVIEKWFKNPAIN
jgi:hypothetical protein